MIDSGPRIKGDMMQGIAQGETYDFCIVGAGTVGIYIAGMLANGGHSVLLVEAGESMGHRQESILDSNSISAGHLGSRDAWTTGFGGTSQLWGGQLWPWQAWELDHQSEEGVKSWPIEYGELAPYYGRVLERLGLSEVHRRVHETGDLGGRNQFEHRDFQMKFSTWMGWRKRNFGNNRMLLRRLRPVNISAGIVIDRVDVGSAERAVLYGRDSKNAPRSFAARRVVLAAGTLGNTRILAGSEISMMLPALGTGFMDHVSKRVMELKILDWKKFRRFASHRFQSGVLTSPRIVPTEDYIRRRQLLPCYAHFEFELSEDSFPAQLRKVLRANQQGARRTGFLSLLASGLRDLPDLSEAIVSSALKGQRPILRSATPYLRVDVQQPARAGSRLTWVGDKHGGVKLDLSWNVGEEELASANEFGRDVMAALERVGIGAASAREFPEGDLEDIFHMMGGTPMGDSALDAVVDPNQRVFGTENIYIAGASVFPSGGLANPTFTALALTHRLARHIGD